MKPERWRQIDKILKAALDREESQRAGFLDQACGEDEALRKKVEALLAAHKRGEDFLEEPALEMAAKSIAKDHIEARVGKQIGSYKILSLLGAGGMGEVYRARDMKLEREVAIKVLPAEFTQDPERLARFQPEAKLLASLNHPNIAAIHGLEESDGVQFLVLELVEGKTLAELVSKRPLSVQKALDVCRQIAEGLEAAHEKGVIHRDLKPANVKLTPEGKIKILDFGLAKAFEAEPPVTDISQSPTLTEEMTRAGVILGTAAYMSPEQARGKPVDKRSDVFAFGCVLYELLTGNRAFVGETVTDTLAKILEGEPKWDALPGVLPSTIRFLISRCLQKDPGKRLQHIDGARILIEEALTGETTASTIGLGGAVQPAQQRWVLAVGLVVGAVVAGLAVWLLIQPSPPEQSLNRFVIRPSPPVVLASVNPNEVAISPDGRQLVYMGVGEGGRQLYLRSLDDFVDRPIPGTATPSGNVFFSPDSKSIGFFADLKLKKTSLAGGSPITLCDAPPGGRSGDWFEDTIVFTAILASGKGLYRVSANGGEPEMLATVNFNEGELGYILPDFLPDGKNLLFSIRSNTGHQTALLSLETGERKVVLENARQARYLSTGHLVYEQSRTGNLMAVPFDLAALEVTGDSVQVVQGVRQALNTHVDYTLSDEGTLVYVPEGGGLRILVWVDREGREERLGAEPRGYFDPRISPDGSRLAVTVSESGGGDVWIYDLEREIPTRLTFDPAQDHMPVWTPDGQRVVFDSTRDGAPHNLFWKAADGTGPVQRLTTSPNTQGARSFSPDGKSLVHRETSTSPNLHVLSMEGEFSSQPLLDNEFNENNAEISPSGRFIAYESNESGQNEIYVRPFPNVDDGKWQISRDGGTEPVWAPQGQELFYRSSQALIVVGIKTEPTFTYGSPEVLFTGNYLTSALNRQYDVAPDGQRFLMIKQEQTGVTQINIILNWFEELKRLVQGNR